MPNKYNPITNTIVIGDSFPFLFSRIRCKLTGTVYKAKNAYTSPEGDNIYTFVSDCGKSFDSAIYTGFFDKYETVQG